MFLVRANVGYVSFIWTSVQIHTFKIHDGMTITAVVCESITHVFLLQGLKENLITKIGQFDNKFLSVERAQYADSS